MEIVNITIKGRPYSVNQTYATGPSKGRGKKTFYMKPEAKAYMQSAGWQARMQYKGKPMTEDLEVEFVYYFGDQRVHDHLNFQKLLNDSLNQIVWQDDKQIKVSHHYTMFDSKNPRVELKIIKI